MLPPLTPQNDDDSPNLARRDQLRQRLIDAEFTVPEPSPMPTVFDAWRDLSTLRDWRDAIAAAAAPLVDGSPALKALQREWGDTIERLRDQAPPPDWGAIVKGETPPWLKADDLCGRLTCTAAEIGAVAGFALALTWSGDFTELPTWLARALALANIDTYHS